MELKAALEGLIVISKPTIITIFTDSRYLQQGVGTWEKGTAIRGWINKWRSNGWQKKDGPLLNSDLWRQMYDKVIKHTRIMTKYVPGHKGHVLNERCDKLAKQALERLVQKNEQNQI
jgi:ribonuclease HI